jgi:type II secretory pathway pseudopilin PulG
MSRHLRRKLAADRVGVTDEQGRSERGDTLIEVLLALFVLGLTALALIIAFSTSISATQRHRQIATANIVLDSASQQAISQIEQNTSLFGCGYSVQAAAFVGNGVNFTIPANYGNYTAQIYNVEYWNASQNQFVTGCIPGNVPMEVEVEVTDPSDSETYFNTFVVDLPSGDLGIGPDLSNGIPSQLVFGGTPGETATGSSGVAFSPQPVVSVLDSNNEIVESDLSPIIPTIEGPNPNGATISGCSANDPDGVATFSGCTITGKAGTYLVHATVLGQGLDSDPSGTGVNANSINVFGSSFWESTPTWYGTTMAVTIAPAPDKVVFVSAPVGGNSGSTIPNFTINIDTLGGAQDGSQSGNVTLSLSGGSLTNCASTTPGTVTTSSGPGGPGEIITVPVVAGAVTLTGCQFSGAIFYNGTAFPPGKDATHYTITASYTGSTSATSQIFATGAGTATKLVFITQPSGVSSTNPAATWPSSFSVEIEDAFGNPVWTDDPTQVSVKFNTADAVHETLNGLCNPPTSVANSGIAVFGNCNGSAYGGGLILTATFGAITANSAPFSISSDAESLKFTTQPVAGPSGSALTTQPVVTIYDGPNGTGNVDTGFTGSITLTSSGGQLKQCTGLTPNNGVVNVGTCLFAGNAGTPYTLTATVTNGGGTLLSTTSTPFTPSQAGVATQLQFTTQPVAGAAAGSLMTTQPVVKVEDSQGNVVTTSTATITLTSSGGTLTGCTTLTAVAGVVNVSGCSFGGLIGSFYTLSASSLGLTTGTSQLFASNTGAGVESGVLISAAPTTVPVDTVTNVAITLQIVDAWGNDTVSTGATNLTVSSSSTGGFFSSIEGNAGSLGFSTMVNIAAGNSSGTVYYGDETTGVPTITAYNSVTVIAYGSTSLTINPNVGTQLLYATAPPTSTAAGAPFSVVVFEEDEYYNVVTTDNTTSVSLAASNGTSSGGFTCSATTEVVNAGVATFSNCTYSSASANPYTLTASAAGLSSATATTTVTTGAAAHMSIWSGNNQSAKTGTAFANPLSVLVTDSGGNPVSGETVTFMSPTGNKSGTMFAAGGACAGSGTVVHTCTAVTNVNGIASALTLTAGSTVGSYAVSATDGTLSAPPFNETNSGGALVFLSAAQTFTTVAGSPGTSSGSITIQAQDGNGNPVLQASTLTVNLAYVKTGVTLTTAPPSVMIPAGSSSVSFTLVASTSTGGTVAVTGTATGDTATPTQTDTVKANAGVNITTVTPTSPQTVASGASVTYPVKVANATGTNLYYKVIAVYGLNSVVAASGCSAVTNHSSAMIPTDTVTTSATQASGPYTLEFLVGSFTNASCNGTPTAYYQGDGQLTVNAGAAATIAISGGNSQMTAAGTAFNSPLSALVTDSAGDPVAGVPVTFTSPSGSAGGTFLANGSGVCVASGGTVATSCTAMTGANGIASSLTFTANTVSGTYAVSVTAPAVTGSPLVYEEENQ